MKMLKKIGALAFVLLLMLSLCANAFAADPTYTVRIYAGNIGEVDGANVVTISGIAFGDTITVLESQVKVDDDRFYAIGFREAGHDNNPYYTFGTPVKITRDMDFVIGYGMKSTAVQYMVSYLHATTRVNLLPPQIFYGNIGDKPVVAFQYVENYRPQALAITKTLTSDPTQNVFEFLYTPINTGGGAVVPPGGGGGNANQNANQNQGQNANQNQNQNENQGQNANQGGTAGGNAGTETPGTETNPAGGTAAPGTETPGTEVAPAEPVEILDLDVPQAAPEGTEQQGALSGVPTWVIAVGSAIAGGLIIVPLIYLFVSKKKQKEETK